MHIVGGLISAKYPAWQLLTGSPSFPLFAALTGHGDAVRETARVTDSKIELDESVKEE
jgi:hypothetical protein